MKDIENKKYWIWLSLIKGLGTKKKIELLKEYKHPKEIYNLKEKDLIRFNGIGEKTIESILNKESKQEVDKHLKYMEKNDIDIVNINDKEYPEELKEIYDPPISLYIRGNKEILNDKKIAIVGCREATEYGKKVAKYFSYKLTEEKNVTIVSGLARGIDSISHIGCLEGKGKTIAVVGNGLDLIYPKENIGLANEIINKNGTIISEYPLGTKPLKMNFPARNRIISGISKGIIVVEAKEKSGTMITVDFALEQGKDVYVVPGNINSINSVGTNELIKQGAKMVTNINDIVI